ncbi:ABC transporter permease [Thiomicrorhabdus aquaedulcis]|uniref:ABC transporter permease n=1 Tax=Thiomicrorhabdus aquaedulcis TaxID=2211106 RepID=UPI000FD93216|nr:ABC transporter permease [Thiomicrorhabdus aquaedulcis]
MTVVFLWTDIMVWSLVFIIVLAIKSARQSMHTRQQWRRVFASPIAMSSTIILMFYLTFALLDSVHLKQTVSTHATQADSSSASTNTALPSTINQSVYSLLDLGLMHLIEQQERTYSAPFALTEYSSSLVYDAQGQVQQRYVPLQYAGQHLLLPTHETAHDITQQQIARDVLIKSAQALGGAMLFMLVVLSLYTLRYKHVNKATDTIKLPLRAAYITVFVVISLLTIAYYLSHFYHVLGTDKVGADVLYKSLKSIRTGVLIGVLTTLVMLPLALILGISAGYFKGWVDDVIQYLYTTLNSIPGVLLIAAAVLVMQVMMSNHPEWFTSTEERADMRLLFLIFILGVTSWTGLCRLLRAETLKISQIEYVSAAKAFGVGPFGIIKRHIMPNLMHLVLIALVLDFSGLVLAEAVLSYVGVGVDPTMHSWGNMINQARLEMAREPMVWWSLFSAFFFMFILVLAANLFSDRVQTVLDPRGQK